MDGGDSSPRIEDENEVQQALIEDVAVPEITVTATTESESLHIATEA